MVDIPVNETAQKGLQEVRRQIAGMECMLQMYNRYQSMEEYQKVVGMMQEFNRALYRNISDIYERRPTMIEKNILIKKYNNSLQKLLTYGVPYDIL